MRRLEGAQAASWLCYACGWLATETGTAASIAERLNVARAAAVGISDHVRDAVVETARDVEHVLERPLERAFERIFGKR
jgi:hypothetical protein